MKKNIKVAKHARPNHKSIKPAITKTRGQSRKGGKGALMHAAARPQSKSQIAQSNQSPAPVATGKPQANQADYALSQLTKGNA